MHIALNFDKGIISQVTVHIFVRLTVACIIVCGRYIVSW